MNEVSFLKKFERGERSFTNHRLKFFPKIFYYSNNIFDHIIKFKFK
jgi:hypothetical protein